MMNIWATKIRQMISSLPEDGVDSSLEVAVPDLEDEEGALEAEASEEEIEVEDKDPEAEEDRTDIREVGVDHPTPTEEILDDNTPGKQPKEIEKEPTEDTEVELTEEEDREETVAEDEEEDQILQ